jgi:hypothetical protein
VDRLLAELDPGGRERAQVRDRLRRRAPRAIGVDADRELRPARSTDRRDAPRVVADPDLDLHAAEPGRDGGARRPGGSRPVLRRDRRVHRHRVRRALRKQVGQPAPRAARCAVPQREVDRRERLRQRTLVRARREQRVVRSVRAGVAQDRAVRVERRLHRRERHAVVGLERRRLADAPVARRELEPHHEQLPLAQLAPRRAQR